MTDFIQQLFFDPSAAFFITVFLKAFAVLFSFLYLLYAIVITRQTQEMNQTFTTKNAKVLFVISATQILFAFVLILCAFVL